MSSIQIQLVPTFGESLDHARAEEVAISARIPQRTFDSEAALKSWMESKGAPESYGWLVVLPVGIGRQSVFELLSWIKRHPQLHFALVLVIADKLSEAERQEYIRAGAWAVMTDSEPAALKTIVRRVQEHQIQAVELLHLESVFASELSERLAEIRESLAQLDAKSCAKIYRCFHTIKGSAQTLQYPVIARIVHEAESLIQSVQTTGDFSSEEARCLLASVAEVLEKHRTSLENNTLLDTVPVDLLRNLQTCASAAKGLASGRGIFNQDHRPARVEARIRALEESQGEQLTEVSERLGNALKAGREMSVLLTGLGDDFPEESFPRKLEALLADIQKDIGGALSTLDSLQSVPLARMKSFLERVVADSAARLGKVAHFEMVVEPGLSVDARSYSTLRRICMHLARNSVDHGLEDPAGRAKLKKPERGAIRFQASTLRGGALAITFEDDGAGIDLEALREFFRKIGGAAFAALEKLPENQLLQLVFSESFSSREVVSDISGRGIGLADVKHQVIELGGMIDVSSVTGKGARFTIILPRNVKR